MGNQNKIPLGIKFISGFFILSIVLWTIGQGGAVISYDSVAKLGFQDTRECVDPVIVEVNRGIAFGDVVIQLPLFILAVVGLWRLKYYGAVASWMALAIHLYWTSVAWAKQFFYLNASIKCQPIALSLHGGLAFFFLFSAWAIWYLFKKRAIFD